MWIEATMNADHFPWKTHGFFPRQFVGDLPVVKRPPRFLLRSFSGESPVGLTLWLWLSDEQFAMVDLWPIEIVGLPFLKMGGSFHGEMLVKTSCLAPKTRKKHRGIEAWLRQCGSDEDTKLVTEVRRLQLRMAHTFLNVLLGPLTHEPPKRCRQDDDYFCTISWKVMLLFRFFLLYYKWMRCQVFGLNMDDVIFLKDVPSAEFSGEFWCVWRRFDPGNASNEKGPGNFRWVSSPLKLVSF